MRAGRAQIKAGQEPINRKEIVTSDEAGTCELSARRGS